MGGGKGTVIVKKIRNLKFERGQLPPMDLIESALPIKIRIWNLDLM